VAVVVAPVDVAEEFLLDRFVVGVVGAGDDEAADGGEVALDPVEPGAVGGEQHELCVVLRQPRLYVCGGVAGEVVADDVQPLVAVVALTQPAEEVEEVGAGAASAVDAVE